MIVTANQKKLGIWHKLYSGKRGPIFSPFTHLYNRYTTLRGERRLFASL